MLTSTGKIMPSASLAVLALTCLQKSMMLTPWGPSAVPTGGAGVALPAGNCSLTVVCSFFGGIFPLPQSLFFLRPSCEALIVLQICFTQVFRHWQNRVPQEWIG